MRAESMWFWWERQVSFRRSTPRMSDDDDELATNAALAAIVASNTADERALARRLLPRVLAQAVGNGHSLHGDGDTIEWAGTVLLVALTTWSSDRIALFDQGPRRAVGHNLVGRVAFQLTFFSSV